MLQLSEGTIQYGNSTQAKNESSGQLANEDAYRQISFCAPYLDVIEEMTLLEFLNFHNQFKTFINQFSVEQIVEEIDLRRAANKQIRFYSSGMKQRVKLAQAIFSDASIVLLDEPCSNLDTKGIQLYHSLVDKYCRKRLVIVCSNDEVEYSFTNERINILDYKKGLQN
jgi:ABC-type multidrug transport system ATPase subunit